MDRPILAFYCCYLLRSTVRHQSLYVGSTPNPVRRLRQHNGGVKGGAVRTSRQTLRPWDMVCLVIGFPSKIAALQFEWAWQNTHLTRHILPEERITQINHKTRFSPKTGKTRKKVARPKMGISDKLANLHILLNAKSFQRWPLEVRFFASDVHKMWTRLTLAAHLDRPHARNIKVTLDANNATLNSAQSINTTQAIADPDIKTGIHALDVTYQSMKPSLERSLAVLQADSVCCSICDTTANSNMERLVICSNAACKDVYHLACIGKQFLSTSRDDDTILPLQGQCPTCKVEIAWSDLVRDLSLRTRGEKERTILFRQRRRKKGDVSELNDASHTAEALTEAEADDASELEIDDDLDATGFRLSSDEEPALSGSDNDWHSIDGAAKSPKKKNNRKSSPKIKQTTKTASKRSKTKRSNSIVQDSDWDDAEVLG